MISDLQHHARCHTPSGATQRLQRGFSSHRLGNIWMTRSFDYQPNRCTIIRKLPENYHIILIPPKILGIPGFILIPYNRDHFSIKFLILPKMSLILMIPGEATLALRMSSASRHSASDSSDTCCCTCWWVNGG